MDIRNLPNKRWLLLSELTNYVPNVTVRTLRRWCESGDIPASRRGTGRWYVDLRALKESWLEELERANTMTAFEAALQPPNQKEDDDE